MDQDWQHASIEAAEQELLKLKGTGRQLLEALADASNTTSKSQQVASSLRHPCWQKMEENLMKMGILNRGHNSPRALLLQVANIISATEEALIKAETLTRQLTGAFDPDGLPKDRSRSRIDLIRKRKVIILNVHDARAGCVTKRTSLTQRTCIYGLDPERQGQKGMVIILGMNSRHAVLNGAQPCKRALHLMSCQVHTKSRECRGLLRAFL